MRQRWQQLLNRLPPAAQIGLWVLALLFLAVAQIFSFDDQKVMGFLHQVSSALPAGLERSGVSLLALIVVWAAFAVAVALALTPMPGVVFAISSWFGRIAKVAGREVSPVSDTQIQAATELLRLSRFAPEQLSQPGPYQAPEVLAAVPQAVAAQASAQMLAALLTWRLSVYLIAGSPSASNLNPLLSLFFLVTEAVIVLRLAMAYAGRFAGLLTLAQAPKLGLLMAGNLAVLGLPLLERFVIVPLVV